MKELMRTRKETEKKSIQLDVQILTVLSGTIFGSEITKHWGEQALEDDTYVVNVAELVDRVRSLHSKGQHYS